MAVLLTEEEISARLPAISGWERSGREIRRLFRFADFQEVLGFVNAVGGLAEEANHHPDIDIRWSQVLLRLSTHSQGGLTERDFALAGKINALK